MNRHLRVPCVVLSLLGVAACAPSDQQRRALHAWFDCLECDAGELDSLLTRADWRLMPDLAAGLRGPSDEELAHTTARLRSEFALLAGGAAATTEAGFATSFLSNFVAQRQQRSVEVLGQLQGWPEEWLAGRMLKNALAQGGAYRDDVREAIRAALTTELAKTAGDGLSDSAWRPVRTPPRVRVLMGATPAESVDVRFAVLGGDGRVSGYRQPTDAAGEASPDAWVIGEGQNTLGARVGNDSAVFTVTGTPASRMVLDSAPPSTLPAGGNATTVVRLLNPSGDPSPGLLVRFAVLEGGGSLFQDSAFTSPQGMAWTVWTVGAGPNVLRVRATGFPDMLLRTWGRP